MKTLIVFNPHSGKGEFVSTLSELIDKLKKRNIVDISVFSPSYPKEITDFLLVNGSRFDLLILSGGDGTLNECINALMKISNKPKLLYIPSGTVNDVGHMLKLKRKPSQIISLLNECPVKMDVCQINDRYFLYAAACGRFSHVSYNTKHHKIKKHFGKFYYYLRALLSIFRNEMFTIKYNGEEIKSYLMLLSNTSHLGGFKINHHRDLKLNDGDINLFIFKYHSIFSFKYFLFFMFFGDCYKRNIKVFSGDKFKLDFSSTIRMNTDGESAMIDDTFMIQVHKGALEIFVEESRKKLYFE